MKDIVLISTADWDHPFWTNKQHVALRLAGQRFRVLYVDTIGLRAPSADSRDIKRIFRRFRQGLRGLRNPADHLWVWSPFALPWHGNPLVGMVNRFLLQMGLRLAMARLGMKTDILWAYHPMAVELIDTLRPRKVLYHCVDELTAQPNMPVEWIRTKDEGLTRRADVVVCTAANLYDARKDLNPHVHVCTNVADFAHFSQALNPDTVVPPDLEAIPHPRVGFVGAISDYKIDLDLLVAVAQQQPAWQFVMIGQVGEGQPGTSVHQLTMLSNVHFLGPKPYGELPRYLKGIDVCILPNRLNDYTKNMFPMKFFEYLASGRPVVTVQLPALQEYYEVCLVAGGTDDFILRIEEALDGGGAPLEERLRVASEQTWERRIDEILQLVG